MPSDKRRQLLADFRNQKFDVLCNCQLLTEGWDDPGVSCIIHARPTKSSLLYIQMTGRGTRLAPGKQDCLVIDVVDITKRHSLVTLPSTFGLPANFDFGGSDVVGVLDIVEPLIEKHPGLLGLTLEDFQLRAETVDLFAVTDDVIDAYGTYSWCRVSGNYVLAVPMRPAGSMYLEINPTLSGQWDIALHVGYRTTALASTNSAETAFRWAEKWYGDRVPPSLCGLHRRTDTPELAVVSLKQRTQLETFGVMVPDQTTWYTAETMLTLMKQKGVLPS
jgi:Helicase conserved C-terminal domain